MAHLAETHYDQLNVTRNAPLAVIKASYRVLSQKYHPDRNRAPDAMHVMQAINHAWEVLSDPEKRATHDRWIANQEQASGDQKAARRTTAAGPAADAHSKQAKQRRLNLFTMLTCGLVALSGLAYLVSSYHIVEAAPVDEAVAAVPDPGPVAVERARHGETRELETYIKDGQVTFEFDNTTGLHDVEVKFERDGQPFSTIFVHQGKRYVAKSLPYGEYALSYKVKVNGKQRAFKAADKFPLRQTAQEAKEKRYNRFNKVRVTSFDLAAGRAVEIPTDRF